jgi:hypothetical protein
MTVVQQASIRASTRARPVATVLAHATVLAVALCALAGLPAEAERAAPTATAAQHVMNATDTAYLHLINTSGSLLIEQGSASGALPGTVKARCNVGATLTASFTIYTHGGTIRGYGAAKLSSSGASPSFAGRLSITGGTGRYAHAHGNAGLYGVYYRRTYKLTVQTTGKLHY